mgnify:CR=1 FL=1
MQLFKKSSLILNENIHKKKNIRLREDINSSAQELGGAQKVSPDGADVTVNRTGVQNNDTVHTDVLVPNTATGIQAANAVKAKVQNMTKNNQIPQSTNQIDANVVPVDTTKMSPNKRQEINNSVNGTNANQIMEGIKFSKKEMTNFLKSI